MNKKLLIIPAVLVLILIGAYFAVSASSTTTAYLNIEESGVEVDTGRGWQEASDQMELGINDKIRTNSGRATVVIYESLVVSLEPETEIAIKDLAKDNIKIRQESGATWNKFTGLMGIDSYSVETPTSIASVRGTFFYVGMESVIVGEGTVDVKTEEGVISVVGGKKLVIGEDEPVPLTEEEKAIVIANLKENIEVLKGIRTREIEKHSDLIEPVKNQYKVTEKQIEDYFEKLDTGKASIEETKSKIPVSTEWIDKIEAMTRTIAEQNKIISEIEQQK